MVIVLQGGQMTRLNKVSYCSFTQRTACETRSPIAQDPDVQVRGGDGADGGASREHVRGVKVRERHCLEHLQT